ncbi:hypothetical protein CKAH01_07790 [Colletotrichum kahawae]|uniref:Uncharacterized protein n=1 Tax=Colletotrichum kahawae TaxID=34407 RepID=A0AAE0D164_COLKA|nr:hypothetical protein CKAH01_07790 [Colletotrichum kahawae]
MPRLETNALGSAGAMLRIMTSWSRVLVFAASTGIKIDECVRRRLGTDLFWSPGTSVATYDRVLGVRGTPKPVGKTMPPGRKMGTRPRGLGAGRPRPGLEGCVIFDLGIQGRSSELFVIMLDTYLL